MVMVKPKFRLSALLARSLRFMGKTGLGLALASAAVATTAEEPNPYYRIVTYAVPRG